MINLLISHGTYAHGTIKENGKITIDNIKNTIKEYSLRPKINDKCWKEMIKFKIEENEI